MQLQIVPESLDLEKYSSFVNPNVMDNKIDTRRLILPWHGWSWYECYLQDPSGNRYSPDMVQTSLWAAELAHELAGSPLQVMSLKSELTNRLKALQALNSAPEVVIRWQGVETAITLPRTSHNTYYVK